MPLPSSTRSCQSNASALIALSVSRMVTSLPSGVITRGENFSVQLRQRRDVEMVVMAVRHQHDVDLRQRVEGDAGIVVPLRPGKRHRRGPHRPHGIDENVEVRGLDQPGDVADERQPHLAAGNPRRRRIAVGVRHPIRPARALAVGAELPAQHFAERSRRHSVGIEEAGSVEMIGDGAVIGFHIANPDRRHADGRSRPGEHSKKMAAGDGHAGSRRRERAKGMGRYMACAVALWNLQRNAAPRRTGATSKLQAFPIA